MPLVRPVVRAAAGRFTPTLLRAEVQDSVLDRVAETKPSPMAS
jgi:hypothetical protein